MSKEYQDITDFLEDHTFRDWVLHKDSLHRQEWEAFLAHHPDKKVEVDLAKAVLLELTEDRISWEGKAKADTKKAILQRIKGKASQERDITPPPRRGFFGWAKVAVVAILMLGAAAVAWEIKQTDTPQEVVQSPSWIVRTNHAGQKSIVHLPDGSKVVLNASSTIRYRDDFGKVNRDLSLQGEAFFDVKRDVAKPFSVMTGKVTTTALGTSFNVSAFDQAHPSIKLATGIVEIRRENPEKEEKLKLVPGEEAFMDPDNSLAKRQFDVSSAFLWKDGVLFFDRTPFGEVVKTLERWYAVEITVRHHPENKTPLVSGRFDNDHLDNVLTSIGYSLRFSHEIDQKKVTIDFQ
ncbi:FecR family protein [Echinicola rosea]|uniref:Anti-sigma factor n=1 Tax=Echinicola rosea TaxID=1807691 RepID=A0ABQ1UET7_9BACT|nr:FecR domain-containing protein [Echinicola rosea]GGF16356.1 anti-sigma factor [Echinicola rosea]